MAQPSMGAQASRLAKDFTLSGASRTRMPKLVYGTAWKKDATAKLVYTALKTGFRGIDTAAQPKHYNEAGVAAGFKQAVAEGLVKREDLFIQTKFTPPSSQSEIAPYDFNAPLVDRVHQSVESSLKNFAIEGQETYLDSVILHAPLPTLAETITAYKTLESYHPHKIRNFGISNATLDVVEALYEAATVKPSVVQNRFYPDTEFEVDLRAFCLEHDIKFQSFWTIGANPKLAKSQPVVDVAKAADVEVVPAYYALVMGLEGVTILDGTTNETHMQDDLVGLERIGIWAEGEGQATWTAALQAFKQLIGQP